MNVDLREKDFSEGFIFALHILSSMGDRTKFDDIVAQLMSVARGELSLQPTPEEAIRSTEAEYNKPLPEELKQMFRRILNDRAQADATNKTFAVRMLYAMGINPDR